MSEGAPGAVPLPLEVGGCRIECESGADRSARTYRARRGGRVLAVRVFDPGVRVDRAALERFLIGRPNRIRHPNLLGLEALGEHGGRVYYATKFPRGDSLRKLLDELRRGRASSPSLSPLAVGPGGTKHPDFLPRAVTLVAEVSDGLEAAHREGIIHGRLSSKSLVLSPSGRLVVTGFGEARIAPGSRAEGGAESGVTAIGELACRSPEQLRGERATAAADVHALGVILYELITLDLPFRGRSAREIRRALLRGEIVPPREARPDIPLGLEQTILRALAPDADDRYGTAGGLAGDLRRLLRGELPTAPAPAEPPRVSGKRGPRMVRGVTVAAVLAGTLASATLGVRVAREDAPPVLASFDPASTRRLPPALRAATLEALAEEIRFGSVTPGGLAQAAPALRDEDPRIARAAFRLFAASGTSEPLVRALGIGGEPVSLSPERFLLLHQTLVDIADDGATKLIATWTLDVMQELDGLEPGRSFEVSPGLEVRAPAGTGSHRAPASRAAFTSAWVRGAARLDPASLLHAVPRLLETDCVPSTLLDGLCEVARTSTHRDTALRSLERMICSKYSRFGTDGIRELARLGASDTLLRLVRSWLPPLLREEALDALLESSPRGADDALEEIALEHPDRSVRAKALAHFIRTGRPRAGTSRLVLRALGDPSLRRDALLRLAELEPRERSRTALGLLGHTDPVVRQRAVEVLVSDPDLSLAPSLLLRCLSRESRTRSAALAALSRRSDLERVSRRALGFTGGFFEAAVARVSSARRAMSERWRGRWHDAQAALRSLDRMFR